MSKSFRDKKKFIRKQNDEVDEPKTVLKKKKLPKHKLRELDPEDAQDFVEDFG